MKFKGNYVKNIILYSLAIIGAGAMIFPFLWMISNSFQANIFVIEYPPKLIPEHPTFENFIRAWTSNKFQLYFLNSSITTIAATFGAVICSAMAAYAFARFEFKGKELVFTIFLLVLMVPDIVTIMPKFLLAKTLGLRDSLWGLILFYIGMNISLNTFLLRGFFESQPKELEEAMVMDGANPFKVFFGLALPLAAPALATVTIFSFLANWDEFIWALTIIDNPLKRTLPIAIYSFQGQHGTEWGLTFAAMLIALIPVFLIFVSLQRYFTSGLTAGAFK
jgi:multiple sugar transport system permease protein